MRRMFFLQCFLSIRALLWTVICLQERRRANSNPAGPFTDIIQLCFLHGLCFHHVSAHCGYAFKRDLVISQGVALLTLHMLNYIHASQRFACAELRSENIRMAHHSSSFNHPHFVPNSKVTFPVRHKKRAFTVLM